MTAVDALKQLFPLNNKKSQFKYSFIGKNQQAERLLAKFVPKQPVRSQEIRQRQVKITRQRRQIRQKSRYPIYNHQNEMLESKGQRKRVNAKIKF